MADEAKYCTPLALGVVNATARHKDQTGRDATHLFLGYAESCELDRIGRVLASHVQTAGEARLRPDRVYMGLKVVEVARAHYLAVAMPVVCEETVAA